MQIPAVPHGAGPSRLFSSHKVYECHLYALDQLDVKMSATANLEMQQADTFRWICVHAHAYMM